MIDIVDYFKWRSCWDCIRNSKQRFGRCYLSEKEAHGLSTNNIIKVTLEKFGKNWNECTDQSKYGTFIKKQLVKKKVFDKKINKEVEVTRGDIISLCYDLEESKDPLTFLTSKYY